MKINFDNILPFVRKPAQYINSEWNSVHKGSFNVVKLCLCFPDLYQIGASNLGLEILYHMVNTREDAVCERCYCPDSDFEEILRKENIKLFSIESQTPLIEFDILGFSLQYELCFTNVLNMLDLAGIPVWSRLRYSDTNNHYPLIIAGGPVCSNPLPIKDFFDLIVVGEGEDVLNEIIDVVKLFKSKQLTRDELLKNLSEIDGIYMPGNNKKIKCRVVNLETSFYPTRPIVPYIETTHDRLSIEISRGCVHNCKFCQARTIYHSWRERSPEKIIYYLKSGIQHTGYEEVSLLSFSVSNYSKIHELLKQVSDYCMTKKISLSIPSLRCDLKAQELMPYLIYPHRANLTFGIEAGSERLRSFIGKKILDNEIYNVILRAYKLGWRLLKLYFMIGLPKEEKEDLEAIITLVNKLKTSTPGMKFNVTISPFVPKPHTPFQYYSMEKAESLIDKTKNLTKKLHATVKSHNVYVAQLEALFSRGDEELSKLVFTAWQKGAKFDHWNEKFNYDIWQESIKELNIDFDKYLGIRSDSSLPWDCIQFG